MRQNPVTIMADNVYDEKTVKEMNDFNLFPIIIKSENDHSKILVNDNLYYLFSSMDSNYYFLDAFDFLGKNKNVNIITSGYEIDTIRYGKLVDGDFILYTDQGKLHLTDVLSDTISDYSTKNAKIVGEKTKLHNKPCL